MKKHIMLFQILMWSVVFLAASATFTQIPPPKIAEVSRASEPPVLDGVMDRIWYMVPEIDMAPSQAGGYYDYIDSWFDLFATFRIMYDDENLYFLGNVLDDVPDATNVGDPWENDGFETFLDGDNSKGPGTDGVNDMQLRYNLWITTTDEITVYPDELESVRSNISFGQQMNEMGWTVEVQIPMLSVLTIQDPQPGQEIGFDAQYNDNDTGNRESIVKWNAILFDGPGNAGTNGTIILSDRLISSFALDAGYTETGPAIDGDLDSLIWGEAPAISNNHFIQMNEIFQNLDDQNDCRFFFRLLWDFSFLYVFVEIKDDILRVDNADWWENDVLELQLDGNNSKGASYEDANDMQLAWKHGITANNEVIIGANSSPPDLTNMSFAQKDTEDGWNLEIAFPMSVLGLSSPGDDKEIGLEVQYNDNDKGNRAIATKWWHDSDDHNPVDFGTIILTGSGVSAVEEQDTPLSPSTFILAQNYPNPFNPTTRIQYSVSSRCKVKLNVFSLNGLHVVTLVNENKSPGTYTAYFDASHLTSGIYVYKLQAGVVEQTRKMLLVR